jgi:hypothetical protein
MERIPFSGFTLECPISDCHDGGTIIRPDGTKVRLTSAESLIVLHLVTRPNQWIPSDELRFLIAGRSRPIHGLDHRPGHDRTPSGDDAHTVSVHLANVHRKLGLDDQKTQLFHRRLGHFRYLCDGVLPPDPVDDELDDAYQVRPATRDDIPCFAQHDATFFQGIDVIPESTIRAWFDANRTGFSLVVNAQGLTVGHAVILPLRPEPWRDLAAGYIIEGELKGSDLYSPDERPSINALHIASVVRSPQHTRAYQALIKQYDLDPA